MNLRDLTTNNLKQKVKEHEPAFRRPKRFWTMHIKAFQLPQQLDEIEALLNDIRSPNDVGSVHMNGDTMYIIYHIAYKDENEELSNNFNNQT